MTKLSRSIAALACGSLMLAGCGGMPTGSSEPVPTQRGGGTIHAVAHSADGSSRALTVDYAAAGVSNPVLASDEGSLVIVAVFRDGRVDSELDLETLSISVPLSELPNATSGTLDVILDGSALNLFLEGSANSETRVLAPEEVQGTIQFRYDAPPRPGISLRGDFSLALETAGGSVLRLDGVFDVPVLGS